MGNKKTSSHLEQFLQTPAKSFFLLWVPVLVSLVAEPLTGLVDTAFVARLGAEALAALGVGTVVLSSSLWLFNFLSVGSQTEVSQAVGRKEEGQGRKIASLALMLAVGIGVVLTLLLLSFAHQLTMFMGATGTTHDYALTYIQIRALGMPAVLITMTSTGILYGLGDMRSPLYIAVGVNVLNICLDALLIFGFGPIPPLGIAGAAIASTVSQYLGALTGGLIVCRAIGFTFDIEFSNIKKLMKIGRDMVMRTGSMVLFLLLATRLATGLGSEAGAINQAIRQVWVFTAFFLDATAVVAQSIIGYYYGSAKNREAREVARLVCYWSGGLGLLLMVLMFTGADLVARVLVPTVSYDLFRPVWIIASLFQPAAAIAFVTDGIHWGTGDFKYLRNVVVFATSLAILSLIFVEYFSIASLNLIWWIIGGWVCIRALLGVLRIWPGSSRSPLYFK